MLLISTDADSAQFWARFLIVAYATQLITWLFFTVVFCRHGTWITWRSLLLAGVIPALVMVPLPAHTTFDLRWTCGTQSLVNPFLALARDLGWAGSLFVVYSYAIGLVTLWLLVRLLPRAIGFFRSLTLTLCLELVLVIISGLADLFCLPLLAPIANLQLGYVTVSTFSIFIAFMLSNGGLLPIARARVFESIQEAVLVLDERDNLIDLNEAGEHLIGRREAQALGKPFQQVWPGGARLLTNLPITAPLAGEYTFPASGIDMIFDVTISPITEVISHTSIGRVLVLRNVTGRERMEKALQERAQELTRTNRMITALSIMASRLGRMYGRRSLVCCPRR